MEKHPKEDCYSGVPGVKRDGLEMFFTDHEMSEYAKCRKDPVYFALKYLKVRHAGRLKPLDLYPYQKEMYKNFQEHRFNIILAARQSGKSEGSIGYLVWYAIFHSNKSVAMLAQKADTAQKLFGRIRIMLQQMPFFLQPGCRKLNETSVTFSNGSTIITGATSESSIRGDSVNLLFLDEFGFVDKSAEFFAASYPVIAADPDAKVIIASTANGVGNMFHTLYSGAGLGEEGNGFHSSRIDYFDVPNPPSGYVHNRDKNGAIIWDGVPMRDDKWKKETIAKIGQRKFDQEFSNKFLGTGDGLINEDTLNRLQPAVPIRSDEHMNIYEDCIPDHLYVMCVDVSRGVGLDYSTFNIIDISVNPFKQVVTFRHNDLPAFLFPNEIHKWATAYNEAYVIVESNDMGEAVINDLYVNLNYDNMHLESYSDIRKMGVNMNRKTKNIGCNGFKNILESGRLDIIDAETISEIQTFQAKGNQGYEAIDGRHDDLVMNFVMFGYFIHTRFLHNAFEKDIDIKKFMYEAKLKQIEETKVPFGYIKDSGENLEDELDIGREWRLDIYDLDDFEHDVDKENHTWGYPDTSQYKW